MVLPNAKPDTNEAHTITKFQNVNSLKLALSLLPLLVDHLRISDKL